MEDRAVLVLGVLSRLLSRDIAALCREVSRSPLEAIEHYCPYLLDEEIEVARCQAGGKTQWALLLALIVATGQGGTCAVAAHWKHPLTRQEGDLCLYCRSPGCYLQMNETCPYPNPLKAPICVFMGI